MLSVGIDVATRGGIAAIGDDYDIRYVGSWNFSSAKGVLRLRELQKAVYGHLQNIQEKVDTSNDGFIVSIEEPPMVKSVRSYGTLSQMFGVAQLAAYNLNLHIPLTFNPSIWKKCIGAPVTAPKTLRGKENQKERELHMKMGVKRAVLRILLKQCASNYTKLSGTKTDMHLKIDGKQASFDVYDALGIAITGLQTYLSAETSLE